MVRLLLEHVSPREVSCCFARIRILKSKFAFEIDRVCIQAVFGFTRFRDQVGERLPVEKGIFDERIVDHCRGFAELV